MNVFNFLVFDIISSIFLNNFFQYVLSVCITPELTEGLCVNIRQCPALLQMVTTYTSLSITSKYLKQVNCGYHGLDPMVCCSTEIEIDSNLLPSFNDCGTSYAVQKVLQGDYANLGEFPWMALIEYETESVFSCGGFLISKRYVLTAAHCVLRNKKIKSVRLGEYNTKGNPDCLIWPNKDKFCSHPVVNALVSEVIVHENYNIHNINRRHDIALLKLEENVEFTNFLKPICLATKKTPFVPNFKTVKVAGWGQTESSPNSNILRYSKLPIINKSECSNIYNYNIHFELGDGQLCAGGEGKDSCYGDSGGPLMAYNLINDRIHWFAIGIISFGPNKCGIGYPSINSNISHYLPWIISNLKP